MKQKIKSFLCLISICFVSSCSNEYSNVDLDKMNIIQLNEYNEYLKEENENLKDKYEELYQVSDGRNKQEVIEMMNHINDEVIKSNVMITNESKSFFHSSTISSGSGTIIKEDNNYYYVLTNNHVIYALGNRNSYYVYDYLNNEYSHAQIIFNDANYDMALLRFRKGNSKLNVIKFANKDLKAKENVITIGQPKGQRNSITFGEVLKYDYVECPTCLREESNVLYECLYYSAPTTNGNSGGMIINYNYELVGVVTFGLSDYRGEYVYGAGSPISKVREFLNENNFEVGDSND